MIELHQLPKVKASRKRRLGRGSGSGRGKTAGRGTKGQKARGRIQIGFEGGQLSLIKRLPLYRGKGRNKPFQKKPLIVNLKFLQLLPPGTEVTEEVLVKHKILREDEVKRYGVKILGEGELSHQLIIKLPISRSAAKKVEKAGGRIEASAKSKKQSVQ